MAFTVACREVWTTMAYRIYKPEKASHLLMCSYEGAVAGRRHRDESYTDRLREEEHGAGSRELVEDSPKVDSK